MRTFPLLSHPDTRPETAALKLWVNVDYGAAFGRNATLNMTFCVGAPASRFVIPEASEGERRDALWQSTCFEAFLRAEGDDAYAEWNFAPSGDWAAYTFDTHRAGQSLPDIAAPPYVRFEDNLTWFTLGATIAVPVQRYALNLTAVLEEQDGTKSYWALAHPADEPDSPPDFHDPSCFVARLPE